MLFTHSTVTIDFPSETAPKIQEIVVEYFTQKGSKSREQTTPNTISFKIRFPFMNFDPINFSRDNFIGINPVVLFQRIKVGFFDSSIVVTLKGLRVRYLGFLALIVSIILLLCDGDVQGTVAGIVFFLLLEVLGVIGKKILRHELSSYISEWGMQGAETNLPPRGAAGSGGSEESNP